MINSKGSNYEYLLDKSDSLLEKLNGTNSSPKKNHKDEEQSSNQEDTENLLN